MAFTTSTTLILRTILAYALSPHFELVGIWASMGICYIINTLFSLYYLKSNKKSIPLNEFIEHGHELEISIYPKLDYLKVIDQLF